MSVDKALQTVKESKDTMDEFMKIFMKLPVDNFDDYDKDIKDKLMEMRPMLQKVSSQMDSIQDELSKTKEMLDKNLSSIQQDQPTVAAPEDKGKEQEPPTQMEFATDEQKKKLAELVKNGQLERIDYKDYKTLSTEKADELIEKGEKNSPGSISQEKQVPEAPHQEQKSNSKLMNPQQKSAISKLVKAGVIAKFSPEEFKDLRGEDAQAIMDQHKEKLAELTQEKPGSKDHSNEKMSKQQMKALKLLVSNNVIDKIPSDEWKNMTYSAAENIITQNQDQFKELSQNKKIESPEGEKGQSQPATPQQKKAISKFVEKGKIERMPADQYKALTKDSASKIIADAIQGQDKGEPATEKQRERIIQLVKDEHLNPTSKEDWASLSKSQATKLIAKGKANEKAAKGPERSVA